MYLLNTKAMTLQIAFSDKQCINLNSNDFREWHCTADKPQNLLTYNLFRYFRKVSECVAELTNQRMFISELMQKHALRPIVRYALKSVPLPK